jgi:hypothetical protein
VTHHVRISRHIEATATRWQHARRTNHATQQPMAVRQVRLRLPAVAYRLLLAPHFRRGAIPWPAPACTMCPAHLRPDCVTLQPPRLAGLGRLPLCVPDRPSNFDVLLQITSPALEDASAVSIVVQCELAHCSAHGQPCDEGWPAPIGAVPRVSRVACTGSHAMYHRHRLPVLLVACLAWKLCALGGAGFTKPAGRSGPTQPWSTSQHSS